MPIALDGIRTCISGIRAHSASDCTTTAGTSRVSRMKHFRHSPVSSIAKQSCMKDSNSYLCVCSVKVSTVSEHRHTRNLKLLTGGNVFSICCFISALSTDVQSGTEGRMQQTNLPRRDGFRPISSVQTER